MNCLLVEFLSFFGKWIIFSSVGLTFSFIFKIYQIEILVLVPVEYKYVLVFDFLLYRVIMLLNRFVFSERITTMVCKGNSN